MIIMMKTHFLDLMNIEILSTESIRYQSERIERVITD